MAVFGATKLPRQDQVRTRTPGALTTWDRASGRIGHHSDVACRTASGRRADLCGRTGAAHFGAIRTNVHGGQAVTPENPRSNSLMRPQMREPDELARLLVPERPPNAAQALAQGEAADLPQEFVAVQAFLQTVVRNAAVQVMDVVQALISNAAKRPSTTRVKLTVVRLGFMDAAPGA